MTNPASRPERRLDLTRWNRAGLSRFAYVDGDAASWLEELRIAAMGLVARGAQFEDRLPETWRDRMSQPASEWLDPGEADAFRAALAWEDLWQAFPDQPENARRRNQRLLDQYGRKSGEYGWEIMRAAARAAHVLLGHLDAYANEGYLRTATQWGNLGRLAAMVNYHPAPPSSALTSVGLIADPTDDGEAVEIPRGLAMKYTPPEGGAAVVFETLDRIKVHAGLNAVRAAGWNRDPEPLLTDDLWIDDDAAELASGALAVLASTEDGRVAAVQFGAVERDTETGVVRIALDPALAGWSRGESALHIDAKTVRRGLPTTSTAVLVLKLATSSNYPIGSVIRLHGLGSSQQLAVVGNADGFLKLNWPAHPVVSDGDEVEVETLVPVAGTGGSLIASSELVNEFYFVDRGLVTDFSATHKKMAVPDPKDPDKTKEIIVGWDLSKAEAAGFLYTPTQGAKREKATVVARDANKAVAFGGKPPKGMAVGDLFVRRRNGGSQLQALRLTGVTTREDSYIVTFEDEMPDGTEFAPDAHEFHGPMVRSLRPLDHDRNPRAAFAGRIVRLEIPPQTAREQIRLGRKVLIEDERGIVPPVLATVAEANVDGAALELSLEPVEGLDAFVRGWTLFNLNAVTAGHGETKSPKVLGSGNAEMPLQTFPFSAKRVSFIPSSVSETGTAPDLEVTVGGIGWRYRDLIDPTADGTESWSSALAEDGSLMIHFRRRLPTGTDNVVVVRHRVGVGPAGSVPARAFAKPMKKHRYIRGITQPLAATGGAEREPLEDIRTNASSRLVANGRAVSLRDFERLCRRRTDIWQASAYPIADPSRSENVGIVLVPANGGGLGATLREELTEFVEARSPPGVRVAFDLYEHIGLLVSATVRVDYEKYDRNEVQTAAQAALIDSFALRRRGLGQAIYIAEVTAALERVAGVETATIQNFAVIDPARLQRTASTDGGPSAFFPARNQVIAARPASAYADMAVRLEAA